MAENITAESIRVHLDDLVLSSSHVEDFLRELAVAAAADLSSSAQDASCSVTVVRRKKAATAGSSDARALAMDEIQYAFNDGPCLSALRENATVHVPDLETEHRWPEYVAAVNHNVLGSMLAVPFPGGGEFQAALNLYSARRHAFSGEAIGRAESFAVQGSSSLRLALRIAQLTDARDDLAAAMVSRTTINLAAGAIMAQNRCSQETAMAILKRASSTRNIKLRDLAASVIASVTDNPTVTTHFDV
jgi:hypothetical protein